MKLISMTAFVLEQENYLDITNKQKLELIINYANFLKTPLKLEMFVGENPIFVFQFMFRDWDESDMENSTIEDLLTDDFMDYELTESAIKQLGL